jgi:adenylate cyclase
LGAKWAAVFFLVVAIGSAGGSWHLFQEYKMIIDAAFGITAVLIIYMTLTYLGYANEEAQRRQTRDAFSKYLSPAMVEQVVENPALLSLGGVKREMTLLFCDVRGFTSISELFDAEGLTVLINKLLTPLTDIILARQGTIDKYMGDCIMAFWNAPLDCAEHAEDGCRSALEMVAAMAPLNERLKQEAKEEGRKHLDLKVGLGLNSGDAVVGNMGTAQRMDYSVLGDTVNTAARLEGQSKTYGVDIVLGPNTYEQVTQFAIIELDYIQVKGKTVGLQIYALLGDEEVAKDPAFISIKEAVSEMIQVYRSQAWDKAKELIQKVRDEAEAAAEQEVGPILAVKAASGDRFRLDVLCDLYESRIRAYEDEPPGEDWDGIFIATTK